MTSSSTPCHPTNEQDGPFIVNLKTLVRPVDYRALWRTEAGRPLHAGRTDFPIGGRGQEAAARRRAAAAAAAAAALQLLAGRSWRAAALAAWLQGAAAIKHRRKETIIP